MPASPSPESLIRSALSTPAGIFIDIVLLDLFLPEPEQSEQGSFIVSPEPLHTRTCLLQCEKSLLDSYSAHAIAFCTPHS